MGELRNDGIYMPGGSIERSAVAVGTRARAKLELTGHALEQRGNHEIAASLRELRQALLADADQLGDAADSVYEQAEGLAEELERPEPRRSVALRLLKGIAEDGRLAAKVVEAAHALAQAVSRSLGAPG